MIIYNVGKEICNSPTRIFLQVYKSLLIILKSLGFHVRNLLHFYVHINEFSYVENKI